MAKRQPKRTTPAPRSNDGDPTLLARRALCCITGCGALTANDRLAAMDPQTVQQIAHLEKSGQRHKVAALLASLTPPTTTKAKSAPDVASLPTVSEVADEAANS